jgi:DNA-binding SARP family transcriptional activator
MLGRMSIEVDSRRIALSFGARGRMLAGYLFEFPGRAHRREQLSEMIWGDRAPKQARAALNTALWRLRNVLARDSRFRDCIYSSAEDIALELSPELEIDTHVFDAAARDALARPDESAATKPAELDRTCAMYAGLFLEGDDADWIIAERERLHSLYIRCLCELMRAHAAVDDYEAAIAAGRQVLAADPFRETVMRALAILLFLNGQRAHAIEELGRWEHALRSEVGVNALPETEQLRDALLTGSICDDLALWRQGHLEVSPTVR